MEGGRQLTDGCGSRPLPAPAAGPAEGRGAGRPHSHLQPDGGQLLGPLVTASHVVRCESPLPRLCASDSGLAHAPPPPSKPVAFLFQVQPLQDLATKVPDGGGDRRLSLLGLRPRTKGLQHPQCGPALPCAQAGRVPVTRCSGHSALSREAGAPFYREGLRHREAT